MIRYAQNKIMNFVENLNIIRTTDLSDTIIAVDFDGTVVRHEFPEIGQEAFGAVAVLQALQAAGAKLILWTMRSDKDAPVTGSPTEAEASDYLQQAVRWHDDRGILLYGINENPQQAGWSQSPKAYAHVYIDDAALGCPLVETDTRPYVDWQAVAALLAEEFGKRRDRK